MNIYDIIGTQLVKSEYIMKAESVIAISKMSKEIENFFDCYTSCELWGKQDGPVSTEDLLEFLTENPHMADIALRIQKLRESI